MATCLMFVPEASKLGFQTGPLRISGAMLQDFLEDFERILHRLCEQKVPRIVACDVNGVPNWKPAGGTRPGPLSRKASTVRS